MKVLVALLLACLCSCAVAQSCGALDLVLVVDSSSQVGARNFQAEVSLALSLAVKVGLSNNTVNLAGVEYGWSNETDVFLSFTSDLNTAVVAINDLDYFDNGSAPGEGLYQASLIKSWRAGVPRVVVLMSGSYATEGYDTVTEATVLKQRGMILFAIGTGRCDNNTLQQVVSSPSNFFYAPTFSNALNQVASIASAICSHSVPTTSTTSPYTNTGGGIYCGGTNYCSIGAQCCSDSTHPGSDYYCCPGQEACCYGSCCKEGYFCRLGTCTAGPVSPTSDPYTTTSGSQPCGYNYCVPGAQCCSDDTHPGSDYYCCAGTATCCSGTCCIGTCRLGTCSGSLDELAFL